MSLRLRLTRVAAIVAAVAVAGASAILYVRLRHDLRKQIAGDLQADARAMKHHPNDAYRGFGNFSGDAVQLVDNGGDAVLPFEAASAIPIDARIRDVAKKK